MDQQDAAVQADFSGSDSEDEELAAVPEEPFEVQAGELDDEAFEDAAEVAADVAAAAAAHGVVAPNLVAAPGIQPGPPPPFLPAAPPAGAMAQAAPVLMGADQLNALLNAVGNQQRPQRRKLELYSSGDPTEWLTWRRHCGYVARMNQWDNRRARREIAASMQGAAALTIRDIATGDEVPAAAAAAAGPPPDAADYELLLDAYEARFLPEAAADCLRVAVQTASQEEGESILVWHSRLRNLFVRAYPNLTPAQVNANPDLRDRFILGLHDPEVKRQAYIRRPVDYAAALTEASNLQAGEFILKGGSGKGKTNIDPFAVKKEINQLGVDEEVAAAALKKGRGRSAANRKSRCWRCDKPGHFARDCRAATPPRGRGGKGRDEDRRQPLGRRSSRGRGGRAGRREGAGGRGRADGGRRSNRGRGRPLLRKKVAALEEPDDYDMEGTEEYGLDEEGQGEEN